VLTQAISRLPPAEQQLLNDPQGLTSAQTQAAIRSLFAVFGAQAQTLYNQFIAAVRTSLAGGTTRLFLIAFGFGLAALVVALFLPEISLKRDEFFQDERTTNQT
jgi:uncharacterized membrane protein YidH (DUF202 family)